VFFLQICRKPRHAEQYSLKMLASRVVYEALEASRIPKPYVTAWPEDGGPSWARRLFRLTKAGLEPLNSCLSSQLWGAVPTTEAPGEANNDAAESPEEHENTSDGTDRLYVAVQVIIAVMPLLAISSAVLLVVFSIQAIRYHSPFMTFLALWFLVLGSQACILFETHRVGWKMTEHCCDDTDNSVNITLWSILSITFFVLTTVFIWREPAFTGRFGTTGLYMDVATVALMVVFSIIWMLDTAYMINEVMPIRDD